MTAPATSGVRRHFATIGPRQIHYRRAGRGPALVALHRIPLSSADLEASMLGWGERYTVIAPDLPGYGASSPLAGTDPTLADYADAIGAFLTAIGVERAHLVGEQIGGEVALELAARHRSQVAGLVLIDAPKLRAIEAPHFEPSWDGAHLTWLWSYLRENAAFDPWHRRHAANRILTDFPDTATLHARAIQFLTGDAQGRHYDRAFRAAAAATLPAEAAPTILRQPILHMTRDAPNDAALFAFLGDAPAAADVGPAPRPTQIDGALWHDYVDVPGGQLHFVRSDAGTLPLLVQHDAASSIGTVAPILAPLIGKRTLVAFDMPGSGLSDDTLPPEPIDVGAYADCLRDALDAIGIDRLDFYGMWGGGFVGAELAHRSPGRVRRLVMSNAFFHEGEDLLRFQACYTPSIEPVWHGGHMAQAWHQMRDQGLFYPWFDRTSAGILRREPFLATAMVHERVCSLLQAGDCYRRAYQAHFVYPIKTRLADIPVPTLLASNAWDPNRPHVDALVARGGSCRYLELDADFARWGLSLLPFLEQAEAA